MSTETKKTSNVVKSSMVLKFNRINFWQNGNIPQLFPGAFIHATEDVLLLDLQGVEEVEVG